MNIPKKKLITTLILAVAAVFSLLLSNNMHQNQERTKPSGNLNITFINVSQGDSILLETADGETVLIDGSEDQFFDTHLNPFLDEQNIQQIDTAFATHYHSDHIDGIHLLLEKGMIKQLWLPDYPDTDESRTLLCKTAEQNGTSVHFFKKGDCVDSIYPGLYLNILNPPANAIKGDSYHNNNSAVIMITYGNTKILLTGDIESKVENSLTKSDDIECDILKVAHHGSSTSSSKTFIRAADPTYAVISAGKNNSYGHPHYETLDTLTDEDITVYRTDKDGNIRFTIGPDRIEDITFSK